jgi:hypothetical protein
MTDKELLTMAAKAAGFELAWGGPDGDMARRTDTWDARSSSTKPGDAMRLAVKLGIQVGPYPIFSEPKHSAFARKRVLTDDDAIEFSAIELYGGDPDAATCLAITRVAADIGRAMP